MRANIIDMALTSTAMMRLFKGQSSKTIARELGKILSDLANVQDPEEYTTEHRRFCEWFTEKVRTAEKKIGDHAPRPSEPASYGQAAKVLDMALKVYFYYCGRPSAEVSTRLVSMLNAPVDTLILKCLKQKAKELGLTGRHSVTASTIKQIDKRQYQDLQSLVDDIIEKEFHNRIHRVQYEDMMWRRLKNNPSACKEPCISATIHLKG